MRGIQRALRCQRQADTMNRERILLQRIQPGMGSPAGAHVVLGMNLEKPQRRARRHQLTHMLRLEADTDGHLVEGRIALTEIRTAGGRGWLVHEDLSRRRTSGGGVAPGHRTSSSGGCPGKSEPTPRRDAYLISSRLPVPLGVSMEVQVPSGTSFQALP